MRFRKAVFTTGSHFRIRKYLIVFSYPTRKFCSPKGKQNFLSLLKPRFHAGHLGGIAMQPVIYMEDVRKIYSMGEQEVHALRGISFSVEQGEFLSIMGPSGSGKSTCMNMIGCLDRPTSGIVKIGGRETAKMSEKELAELRNKTVGFVFQQYHLLPTMTVLENVMVPLRYQGIERALRRDMALAALEKVGLSERINHLPNELSGGQKQRVAIARATVTKPAIILADEPTGALDSSTGRAVLELFGEINSTGTTIVIVTHDPGIGASTKRCIRILDGQIQGDEVRN
jgi:putative ABC transport system ATP-binding protein